VFSGHRLRMSHDRLGHDLARLIRLGHNSIPKT
jgi:hypothetical protein